MKKLLLFTLVFLWVSGAYAQAVEFMPGYFVDNDGNRTDCYIRNADKRISPSQLEYRLTEKSETQIATIANVQYFSITNSEHIYERHTVEIDNSSVNPTELSTTRELELAEETLFLRVLLKGKASLYHYKNKFTADKFFIKTDDLPIEQLIYKKYLSDNNTDVRENNSYKQQLWVALPCPDFTLDTFEKVAYNETALRKVLIRYNECVSSDYVNYVQYREKGELSFGVRAGASTSTMEFINNGSTTGAATSTSGTSIMPQVGVDLAYTFPMNRRKWALYFQPTFQSYQEDADVKMFGRDAVLSVSYKYITLPVGLRHSFNLNNDSKLHVNIAAIQHLLLNPEAPLEVKNITMNAGFEHEYYESNITAMIGIGYTFKKKYMLEAAYQSHRMMSQNEYWKIQSINPISLQFGYRLR